MRTLILGLVFAFASATALAQGAPATEVAPKKSATEDLNAPQKTERGWFFFEKDKKKPEVEFEPAPPAGTPPPVEAKKPPQDRCKKADTWTADCGFVNPGMDYDFQAKQRDALLVQMSMSQNDPKAVEQFQYYMRWVMGRASEVANLWMFNMVQNPELDPQAKQPISTFGIRMMSDVQTGQEKEIFKVIAEEGGMLVFFTKSDCHFCHSMAVSMQRIGQATGLPVRNAALDTTCLPMFKEGCLAGEAVQGPAIALQVTTVPAVFLYVKPNTWLRVATGIVSEDTMRSRIFSFFSAYRTAMLKGVNNAQKGRPSVDFSYKDGVTGAADGVESKSDGQGNTQVQVPTEADVANLLGKK